jgi:lipopolysaccharide export system permease protein
MRILHKYIGRELLVTLSLALLVFTFILMAVKILPEAIRLMAQHRVPPETLARSLALMLPHLFTFSVPMALLTACLLVFGRLSADNEITAMRTSGVDLLSVASPVLLISVLLVMVCMIINCHVGPLCRWANRMLLIDLGLRDPAALIEPGQYARAFPGYIVYAARRESNTLFHINVYVLDERGRAVQNLRAERAELLSQPAEKKLNLTLFNVRGEVCDPDEPENHRKWRAGIRAETYPLALDVSRWLSDGGARREAKVMTVFDLLAAARELREQGISSAPVWLEIHKRVAGSFACLAFALIAVPLGMKAHRRETSIGVALSLALAAGYYVFLIVAGALEAKPQFYPEVIVWVPNILYEVLGLWLLWRQARL